MNAFVSAETIADAVACIRERRRLDVRTATRRLRATLRQPRLIPRHSALGR